MRVAGPAVRAALGLSLVVAAGCGRELPPNGSFPVFRLGSFAVGSRQAIAAARSFIDSQVAKNGNGIDLGFRCARPGI